MAKLYLLQGDGASEEVPSVYCVNEDLELQRILEKNPDLIPGEQVNPSDPRHWLVVKREMAVPDPGTGYDRWSIDLFMVDQDGMPTFVECKRYRDTRAKREVVGQMLEYAANGHHYWSKDEMIQFARQAALNNSLSLEEEIKRLQPDDSPSIDDFFQTVQDNLREGQVRLVFFMEEAPAELKSVVDFLNKQMERSEVLLVEARQYDYQGRRLVNPVLFGFSEEARLVKKTVSIKSSQTRKKWDKESFFADALERLSNEECAAVKAVFERAQSLKCEFNWGTGKIAGSYSAHWPHLARYSLFSVYSDGTLVINSGNFRETEEQYQFISIFVNELAEKMKLSFPDDFQKRYPSFKAAQWVAQVQDLEDILESVLQRYPNSVDLL
jgi:hypothetical protein